MASVEVTAAAGVRPRQAWDQIKDPARLGDWLTVHEEWQGSVPEVLTAGVVVVGIVNVKGIRNRVEWTVTTADPPRALTMVGTGPGGSRFEMRFTVRADGDGSVLGIRLTLSGPPFFGPVGAVAAKVAKADVEESLRRFVALCG